MEDKEFTLIDVFIALFYGFILGIVTYDVLQHFWWK